VTVTPKISVVIPTYNHEEFIAECIESILSQTLRPFEIVICDDGSTDGSWEIISGYARRHPELIRAFRHEKNMGAPQNGNFCARAARGDLFAVIEGDDRWLPRKLELEWKALQEHPEAKIAYSNVLLTDAGGNLIKVWYGENEPPPPEGDVFVEAFSQWHTLNTRFDLRNYLMYRSVLQEWYCDENLEHWWDWDKEIRLTARYPVAYSGEALVEFRQHEGGISRCGPEKHFKAVMAIYEKNLSLLENRSLAEAALCKCGAERIIAAFRNLLPLSEQSDPEYSLRSVYERNLGRVNRLPRKERAALKRKLSPLFGALARQAAEEELERGNRALAIGYWMRSLLHNPGSFEPYQTARVVLPTPVFSLLRAAYWKFIRR
jgi:glycosyltransferase involved in cell wall biosynthesis